MIAVGLFTIGHLPLMLVAPTAIISPYLMAPALAAAAIFGA